MAKRRRTSEEVKRDRAEKQRLQLERWEQKDLRKREKEALAAERRKAAAHRAWLKAERSKPRESVPAQYGETIYVYKRVYDAFMKQVPQKISVISMKVVGGSGGCLRIEYTNWKGSRGVLELKDLGPMP